MEDHGVIPLAHGLGSLNSGTGPTETAPPDPKNHLMASLVKSGLRIIGYGCLLQSSYDYITVAAGLLILAEFLGILEELV